MISKAVRRLHCLVLVGVSSTEQLGHLQVPASRRHDQGRVPSALPCSVGASSTEQSGHFQVPASRRHDQGCVLSALPCPRRRSFHRTVGPPPGARIETTCSRLCDNPALPCPCRCQLRKADGPPPGRRTNDMIKAVWRLHCLVLDGASSTDQSGQLQVPASRRQDQGCVPSALPCPWRRQLHRAVGPPPGACIEMT